MQAVFAGTGMQPSFGMLLLRGASGDLPYYFGRGELPWEFGGGSVGGVGLVG